MRDLDVLVVEYDEVAGAFASIARSASSALFAYATWM